MLYITVSENAVFEGSSGSLWLPSAMSRVCLKSIFCWRFEFSIKGYRNRYLKIITTEVVICEANTSNGVVCMCACVCVCVFCGFKQKLWDKWSKGFLQCGLQSKNFTWGEVKLNIFKTVRNQTTLRNFKTAIWNWYFNWENILILNIRNFVFDHNGGISWPHHPHV